MIIKNALVYTTSHRFEKKDILIENDRISALVDAGEASAADDTIVDGEGLYAIPGLVDIHFHGAVGFDFCNASKEELQKIAEYEAKSGVLAICPATMSYNEEILGVIMDKAVAYHEQTGADLVGINLEGPFINVQKAGAQNPEYIMPADAGMFERLQEKSGNLIKLVDIAPETQGAKLDKALAANGGKEYDVAICCVNVNNCEMSAILPVHDGGVVYFFSMATSFTKAALGAEGVGKDIDMIIGNGYTKGHAEITLQELRENEAIRNLFDQKYV